MANVQILDLPVRPNWPNPCSIGKIPTPPILDSPKNNCGCGGIPSHFSVLEKTSWRCMVSIHSHITSTQPFIHVARKRKTMKSGMNGSDGTLFTSPNLDGTPYAVHLTCSWHLWVNAKIWALSKFEAALTTSFNPTQETVKVPLSQPCFDHFFGSCFRGHDEAGLLAFEALQSLPRPARGTRTKRGSEKLESK